MKRTVISLAMLALTATAAFAHDYKVGDLTIDHPVARETPAKAPVSAGYMTITNNGDTDDRLIGASVGFAGTAELHEMVMDGDVMRMSEVEGGIVIPAGESVQLMPGGLHVMFMDMQQSLAEGEEHAATLTFEKAGSVDVTLNVETLATIRAALKSDGQMPMDHSGHGTMKMDSGTDG